MRIIFMGTPDFAVPSLKILVENGHEVVCVITSVDKLGGRGRKTLLQSPVKKYALENDIPVLQPKNLKAKSFLQELSSFKADLQVVVAFRMLPEVVWDMPTIGTINLHGSLLPAYRGAAPINWAIINGETQTGVTTFFIRHEIDTGDMVMQRALPISDNETAGDLHDRMMELGAEVVLETVNLIKKGNYELQKQDETKVSKAPKIFHHDCGLDFRKTAVEVHNFIRGLSPYPTSWTRWNGKKIKVFESKLFDYLGGYPGEVIFPEKNRMAIVCGNGAVEIFELQLEGRKRVGIQDFLNGVDRDQLKEFDMKQYPFQLTEEEWKKKLSPEAYRVLREKGTERAFTGTLTDTETEGVYHCGGCGFPLFHSTQKFHSGCGWPSFWSELDSASIEQIPDHSHGMIRTELVCSNCGGHLGHIFNDGPAPTYQRYCINSVSLEFKPKE